MKPVILSQKENSDFLYVQLYEAIKEDILSGNDGEQAALELLPGEKLDINTATSQELMRLPGIGQAKAEAILADRAANGPYAAPEDLTRVKGISQRMVQQWGSDITVGG